MISLPFRRAPRDQTIDALYGMIVAQARTPVFYLDYGVADTVTGRFEMIVLHLALLLRRLRAAPQIAGAAGQGVFDRFCRDMDDNFREMGIGDLGVPKEMRKVAEAFYGRAKVYDAALDRKDPDELATAIARNVFGTAADHSGARRLVAYMERAVRRLDAADDREFAAGRVEFPDPASVEAPRLEGLSQA